VITDTFDVSYIILTWPLGFQVKKKKCEFEHSQVLKYPNETQNKSLEDMLEFGYIKQKP